MDFKHISNFTSDIYDSQTGPGRVKVKNLYMTIYIIRRKTFLFNFQHDDFLSQENYYLHVYLFIFCLFDEF